MTEIDLSPSDHTLLQALLRGESQAQAALACGLSERTIRRRVSTPAFKRSLRDARSETLRRTSDRLADAGLEAVTALFDLVRDVASPPSVRRAAARDLLDLSMRAREQLDLADRIEDLEQSITVFAS